MLNRLKQAADPGLGEKYLRRKRVLNRDGSFNVSRTGLDPSGRDAYQFLINMSWPAFLSFIFGMYLLVNTAFAVIYLLIGVDQLTGYEHTGVMSNFLNAFFFSTQTLTTVGYGAIAPNGELASTVAAFEAFAGLSGFALVTGLLYGRFSRPNSRLLYSNHAIITPFQDGDSFQFRVVNKRRNVLMEMNASMMLTVFNKEAGVRRYYRVKLETPFIYFFPLNWTLVHIIDQDSPFWGLSAEDLKEQDAEVLILMKGFDDTFGQIVHSRFSYKYDEIVFGGKFTKAYDTDEQGETELNIKRIHEYEMIPDYKPTYLQQASPTTQ